MSESRAIRGNQTLGRGAANIGCEPLLDCREAAALLRIHPKTLLLMARAGNVPAVRFGRLWRFRAADLDQWLTSRVSCQYHRCR